MDEDQVRRIDNRAILEARPKDLAPHLAQHVLGASRHDRVEARAVALEHLERDDVERARMGRGQVYLGCAALFRRLQEPPGADRADLMAAVGAEVLPAA